MTRLDRILIPLDGSERSEQALSLAKAIAKGAQTALLQVARSRDELAGAGSYLEGLAERGSETLVREAKDSADQITAEAERGEFDLVVLTTRGSGLRRWFRKSVSERVMRRASVPVLIAKPGARALPATGPRRILVPLDGSERAERVLPWVAELARVHDAEVMLLTAVRAEVDFNAQTCVEDLSAARKAALEALAGHAADLAREGVSAGLRVTFGLGQPAQTILDVAEELEVDLVAVTSEGRSGLSRLVIGSVAEELVGRSPVPVLLVPKRAQAERRSATASVSRLPASAH